jgi:hypothetical protein
MMHSLFAMSVLGAAPLVLAYLYFLSKFYEIVNAEKPEWLRYKGEPSIFYSNLPRRFDPNVSLRVLSIAFSSKMRALSSTSAVRYANGIRVTGAASLVLIVYIFWYVLAYAGA